MTIFEKIVAGQIPCFKIAEDEAHLAFLDIRPVAPGHTLVIPKTVIDPVFRMGEADYLRLMAFSKKVADRLKDKILCERICLSIVGFEVPHAHVHLIPARSVMDFPWPGGKSVASEELAQMAARIAF
jgi:histidine triad (HIT) family protein